jgi:hypothetical protein
MPDESPSLVVRRVALILHGRIGIWRTRSSHIDNADVVWKSNAPHLWKKAPKNMTGVDTIRPHSTLLGFAAFGRASLWERVVDPNRRAGVLVDCFLHSWHKEIGKELDAMYAPVASMHEEVKKQLDSVRSQHLSMKRALDLAARHEQFRAGVPAVRGASAGASPSYYDLFMVLRYDILWFSTVHFPTLGGASLWLPHWCHRYPLTAESGMLVRAACGNWPAHGEGYLVHAATTVGVYPKLHGMVPREADYDFAFLDWWFVATPRIAATFAHIYDDFKAYQRGLRHIAPFPDWSHFYWGFHINRRLKMRQQVRYVMYEGVDFRLARHWHFGSHCMHFLGNQLAEPQEPQRASPTPKGRWGAAVPAAAAARAAVAASAAPGGALASITGAGVDTNVYYRSLRQARNGARRAELSHANASKLARQCPLDSRVRLYCPWHSPVCPAADREVVLRAEEAARIAVESSTSIPSWQLFGDWGDLAQIRRERRERRRAAANGGMRRLGAMSGESEREP